MKKQMHIRASTLTESQIADLCAWLGTTKTGAMALAIERLWQEMKKEQGAISAIRDALAIESLWAPGENWGEEHQGEAMALHGMRQRFIEVLSGLS